ncbi:MAG TPA: nicotinamide mononucleotide transporter [Bacteroidales bacterium]|nr:nicotinamide mononucleotide transporter [Bacteroidales bacterium]
MTDIWGTLLAEIINTPVMEYIAVITGIISVWYCRKENILVYPFGLVNVLIYVYLFFKTGMYANMAINAVFFITSLYGWDNWSRNSEGSPLRVTILSPFYKTLFVIVIAIISLVLYFILKRYTDSPIPWMDSFTTALFIVAMWLQAIKKRETWILWIVGDILMIPLSIFMGLAFTGLQYLAFLFLATSGYIEWTKSYKTTLKA